MKYIEDGQEIRVGDSVIVEQDALGVVVCDFDNWKCVKGYEDWLSTERMGDGSRLDKGVMVKTEKYGMIYYAEADRSIKKSPINER
jgi:hypothetical protein